MLSFGVTFMTDPPVSETVGRTVLAEENGFGHAWLWDSHVLWQEVYPIFTLMAAATKDIHLGTCVTNPVTRDPTVTAAAMATLNEISGGRMEMGIGRGDSAQRVLGRGPVTVAALEQACRTIRDLAEGREIDLDGTEVQLKWSEGHRLPVWVAAYGPMALRCAGRVADGVILQLADPFIIEWALRYLREGAEQAGRNPADIKVMAAAPAYLSDDLAHAREQVRWFPALVSNHVVDLVKRYHDAELPAALTDYIAARESYDYAHHGRTGSENAEFVTDEVVDRFCVLGGPDEVRDKLAELENLGVDQFNIYSMVDDPRALISGFGREIIPAFR
ncbi:MAG TPA: TIGR03842 family LLM class F420-dependent oxidoreductase [Streptosporangiaceae bacterium]|nr:TIGR03842 family LLM class F420-dependent oxidoreductase [Streptosporangiaceae bacterium]